MPNLTEAGQVETRQDGSKVFTHGHRHPDNVQVVTQEYTPQGQLTRVHVEWSGFAGKVLDVTATYDASGKLLKEEGYRAPEMKTPVTALLRPLPQGNEQKPQVSSSASASDDQPIVIPTFGSGDTAAQETQPSAASQTASSSGKPEDDGIAEGLNRIYGHPDRPDKSQG